MSRSEYLDLIKNKKDQAEEKLRSVITGQNGNCYYHLPKIAENLRTSQLCSSKKVENEIHFLCESSIYNNLGHQFFLDVEAKCCEFVDLNKPENVIFLFNNIDQYVNL